MKTSAGSSSNYHQSGALRIFKRQSHSIDDLMGRIEKCKGDVQWVGALTGESVGDGEKERSSSVL